MLTISATYSNIATCKDTSIAGARFQSAQGDDGDGGCGFVAKVMYAFREMGYSVRTFALTAQQHGLAQSRDRVFLLAVKEGCPIPDAPAVTHDADINKKRTIMGLPSGTR